MPVKIGITGANGHIGRELLRYPNSVPLVGDVRNPSEIEMEIKSKKPDLIVHLASISDVNVCEKRENADWVTEVNVHGTMNVAEVAEKVGCGMILISTDHIFNGNWWGRYNERSRPAPVNFYGFTKLAAEGFREVFPNLKVIRTSYLFDEHRNAEQLRVIKNKNVQKYPTFIQRTFMYLPHFVESLSVYIRRFEQMPKLLHISGTELVSWYTLMSVLAKEYVGDESLALPRDEELDLEIAPRPHKTGLNTGLSKRLHLPQYSYYDGILDMLRNV